MNEGNVVYIYTVEYYSDIKKNEIMSFTGKQMELETIMLSKISHAQKAKYLMSSFTCGNET
jgi:hypothetical protein